MNFPPSRHGLGVRGLGFWWTFPHNVKSQVMILLIVTAGICDQCQCDRMLAKDIITEAKAEVGEARMKSAEPTET
ncbi:hypothetical protein [Nostoc sp. LPT]|uniref:hypothetical protein n=1 Tax=Nostoc sp. LPT TaxID=2815387 RepID=UPI001D87ADA5|nr:hypothetical protein [Nostoc sp. LPT]MBN4004477.1 hypothetical protein [Nostoc sp. LPT]